jgi:hypothetical protein
VAHAARIDGIGLDDLHLRHAAVVPHVALRDFIDARRGVGAQHGGVVFRDRAVFAHHEGVFVAERGRRFVAGVGERGRAQQPGDAG